MGKEAKIVLIVHQKGGVGKTVISTVTATELAVDSKVILIDADPQGSSYLKRADQVDILNLSSDRIPYPIYHYSNIDDIGDCINKYSETVDYIIIDTKAELTDDIRNLIINSDFLIIPLTAGDSDWSSLLTFTSSLKTLLDAQKSKVKMFAFYNKVRKTNRWNEYMSAIPGYLAEYNITIPKMNTFVPLMKQPLQLAYRDEYETIDTITPISRRKGITWKVREESKNFIKALKEIIN